MIQCLGPSRYTRLHFVKSPRLSTGSEPVFPGAKHAPWTDHRRRGSYLHDMNGPRPRRLRGDSLNLCLLHPPATQRPAVAQSIWCVSQLACVLFPAVSCVLRVLSQVGGFVICSSSFEDPGSEAFWIELRSWSRATRPHSKPHFYLIYILGRTWDNNLSRFTGSVSIFCLHVLELQPPESCCIQILSASS